MGGKQWLVKKNILPPANICVELWYGTADSFFLLEKKVTCPSECSDLSLHLEFRVAAYCQVMQT